MVAAQLVSPNPAGLTSAPGRLEVPNVQQYPDRRRRPAPLEWPASAAASWSRCLIGPRTRTRGVASGGRRKPGNSSGGWGHPEDPMEPGPFGPGTSLPRAPTSPQALAQVERQQPRHPPTCPPRWSPQQPELTTSGSKGAGRPGDHRQGEAPGTQAAPLPSPFLNFGL